MPVIHDLSARILAAIAAHPDGQDSLDMQDWHRVPREDGSTYGTFEIPEQPSACGTTHCVAGWALVVAGFQGEFTGPTHASIAENLFSAAEEECPSFHALTPNEEVLEVLRRNAARHPLGYVP